MPMNFYLKQSEIIVGLVRSLREAQICSPGLGYPSAVSSFLQNLLKNNQGALGSTQAKLPLKLVGSKLS
jgi:acyl CoA:acetate/3-ketoacid CoA transferase beta subunit